MSAEILRRAAAQIRNDHGGVVSRRTRDGRRWLPVADWLDREAALHESLIEHGARGLRTDGQVPNAFTVARAYLGDQ